MDIIPFITGGLTIGMTTLVTKKLSGKAGAIFWSLPLSLIPVSFFVWYLAGKKTTDKLKSLFGSVVLTVAALLAFSITARIALNHVSYPVALAMAFAAWGVVAFIMYFALCPSPTGGKCIKT
jgi:uncharacterized membrane protein (GlpM family)